MKPYFQSTLTHEERHKNSTFKPYFAGSMSSLRLTNLGLSFPFEFFSHPRYLLL